MSWLFEDYNDFFELYFFQGGMIVQYKSLITLKNKTWVNKFDLILDFL